MLRRLILLIFLSAVGLAVLAVSQQGSAMQMEGCGAGKCADCHSLSSEEAQKLLAGFVDDVAGVKLSEVGGLWEVEAERGGSRFPIYMDFSKQFIFSGRIIRIATREDIARKRAIELNSVDLSRIPLDDAIVVGDRNAKKRIIVFDDPECPYCIKLHAEMKKVIEKDPSVAFFIKMFPLVKIHPKSYEKAKAIVCEKSLKLLEDSFAGKDLPPATCDTDQVDRNLKLGEELSIRSTPSLILPNGLLLPGYKKAEDILQILESIK